MREENKSIIVETADSLRTAELESVLATSEIAHLTPFLDDRGLLRVTGRLQFAPIDFRIKHPIILPRTHPVTAKIVLELHRKCFHGGENQVKTLLREHYWMTSCTFSTNLAPLPQDRVELICPFYTIGMDHVGPFYCYEDPPVGGEGSPDGQPAESKPAPPPELCTLKAYPLWTPTTSYQPLSASVDEEVSLKPFTATTDQRSDNWIDLYRCSNLKTCTATCIPTC